MKTLEYLKRIREYLKNPDKESIAMSMSDVHHPGLFSLVIKGTEPGNLTRVFIAEQEIKPYAVQLHTHRYPISLYTLTNGITHYTADESYFKNHGTLSIVDLEKFNYSSVITGGGRVEPAGSRKFILDEYKLPITSYLTLESTNIHTISCEKDSMWIIEESGIRSAQSTFYGVPFHTSFLYNKAESEYIQHMINKVLLRVEVLIGAYDVRDGKVQ